MPRKKNKGFAHEDRGNQNHEWGTPRQILELLGLRYDLDPCHPPTSVGPIPVDEFVDAWYTKDDDGLKSEWFGRVFMNPPYGNGIIHWMAKMAEHGNGIALVFARTDVRWYREYALQGDGILYLKTRLKFLDMNDDKDEAKARNGAGAGSMLVAWGDDCVAALAKLKHLGDFRDLRIERMMQEWQAKPSGELTSLMQRLCVVPATSSETPLVAS